MRSICVVGTGYVGLVTGTCLADFGNRVVCVDIDESKITQLREGKIPFYEPGLKEMVLRNHETGRLTFDTSLEDGVKRSEVIFIAVGTPSDDSGHADLKYVRGVAEEIAKAMNGYKVIVTKSTVPTGTGSLIESIIKEHQTEPHEFAIVSNPEFLREGSAIEDFMHPDRIVIGTESPRAMEVISKVYEPLYLLETPIVKTNVATAEMIKYASNAFLATKISYINEMANICERVGADVGTVSQAMGLDKRIGPKFLHAGAGYGGSCFPKDTKALVYFGQKAGYLPRIVQAVIEVNEERSGYLAERVKAAIGGSLKGKTVGMLGLSFKPNTDDIRDSPALALASTLLESGCRVQAFDPVSAELAKAEVNGLELRQSIGETLDGADCLILMTEWNEFRDLDLKDLHARMKAPVFLDFRNVYEPRKVRDAGFEYHSVGRV